MKRRAATGLTTLMIISGLTGVAWASDGAVPGDWNYGINQAMESLGIGNGGAEERLQELAEIRDGEPSHATAASRRASQSQGSQPSGTSPESTEKPDDGLARAAEALTRHGSDTSEDVRGEVSTLLTHLLKAGEIDGVTIAEMARNLGNKPDDPGRP